MMTLKLKAKYLGPYKVVKVFGKDWYEVEKAEVTAEGPMRTSTAADYMKRWPGCMEVLPERAEITYLNPKYMYPNATLNVRRYSRRSRYYINLLSSSKHTWANNITVTISINQLLHNEYRPSFVTMSQKFCDLVNKEPFVGGAIRNAGVVCPLPAGYHAVTNITAPTEHFPSVFPFEKGRIDVEVSITDTKESVLQLGIVASFKQKP